MVLLLAHERVIRVGEVEALVGVHAVMGGRPVKKITSHRRTRRLRRRRSQFGQVLVAQRVPRALLELAEPYALVLGLGEAPLGGGVLLVHGRRQIARGAQLARRAVLCEQTDGDFTPAPQIAVDARRCTAAGAPTRTGVLHLPPFWRQNRGKDFYLASRLRRGKLPTIIYEYYNSVNSYVR